MNTTDGISIIIPTYNESESIGNLIRFLKMHGPDEIEIIVSDGGSDDCTVSTASRERAVVVKSPSKGRAAQMNFGASVATYSTLYFVHADCFPPQNFYTKIMQAISKGFSCGRFRTKFQSKRLLLKINAFFTRFDWFICYGGDQTFFITKAAFNSINGFNSSLLIMEDYDIVKRSRMHFRYAVLKDKAFISSRKYTYNGWLRVQLANNTIVRMYRRGASQEEMVKKYKQLLNYR